jgi:hypothetical protein
MAVYAASVCIDADCAITCGLCVVSGARLLCASLDEDVWTLPPWRCDKGPPSSILNQAIIAKFDNVSHKRLLHNLRKRRIDRAIISRAVAAMYARDTAVVPSFLAF